MSQSEAFERSIARNDRSTLTGKLLNTATTTATPSVILSIEPLGLSPRTVAFAALFAEYHINYLRVKFISSTAVNSALGVLDDASGAEGDAPSSVSGVLELRCSASSLATQTVPTEFTYTQKASSFWLKTYPGASGSDPRLAVAGLLYGASSSSASVSIEVDYSITFQGAVDVGSSVTVVRETQNGSMDQGGTPFSNSKPSNGFPTPLRPLR